MPDPFGYGRVSATPTATSTAIVEEKDATAEQREIHEINSGIFAFDARVPRRGAAAVSNDNAKGEYYLTDTVGIARDDGPDRRRLPSSTTCCRPRAPTTASSSPRSAGS